MARRNNRRRPRRRIPRRGRNNFVITAPAIIVVKEAGNSDLTFEKILGNKTAASFFVGISWRLTSVRISALCLQGNNQDSGILQIGLHTAENPNVENVSIARFMVGPGVPLNRVLRMKSPNPWKEDEQKAQTLISVHSLANGTANSNQITVYLECRIQFGRIPLLPSNHNLSLVPTYFTNQAEGQSTSSYEEIPAFEDY